MTAPATNALHTPFALPNGQSIKNRIAKSAMSETLAGVHGRVPDTMAPLYRRFAEGGLGLQITGNVMIDGRALGEPGNVVIEDERDLAQLKAWAQAGQAQGARIYMQVNHPGRQAPSFLNRETVAPSAVPLSNPGFGTPRALLESEIEDIVTRFGNVAAIAEKAGFDGVQIHGAHGYLVSQFLSPHTNQRTDGWGGSADKRRRFPLAVYKEMRRRTGPDFGVAIKINSADFQKGGTTEEESVDTILALAEEGMDFIEISGGTYEAPAMVGAKQSTREREAYFIRFAEALREHLKVPLGVTGGWRTGRAMAEAIEGGAIDFVGLARGLAVYPDFPSEVLANLNRTLELPPRSTGIRAIDRIGMVELIWYERQLHRMGAGKEPKPDESGLRAFFGYAWSHGPRGFRTRRAR